MDFGNIIRAKTSWSSLADPGVPGQSRLFPAHAAFRDRCKTPLSIGSPEIWGAGIAQTHLPGSRVPDGVACRSVSVLRALAGSSRSLGRARALLALSAAHRLSKFSAHPHPVGMYVLFLCGRGCAYGWLCGNCVECQSREDNVCSSEGCQESELLESRGEATPRPTHRATNCRDKMSPEAAAREAVRVAPASELASLRISQYGRMRGGKGNPWQRGSLWCGKRCPPACGSTTQGGAVAGGGTSHTSLSL